MGTYSRRTFLRQTAALSAAAAADRLLLPPVFGRTSLEPARPPAAPAPEVSSGGGPGRPTPAQEPASRRGADHPFFASAKNRPEVIAHRGGEGQWPGGTMFAYKKSMELGVDVLEMDVYLTKDDHLVLMHDNNIKSTTNYTGRGHRVREFTLAQLKGLNAAYKWSPAGTDEHPYRNDPDQDLKVTSLEEVFREFPGMRMIVEMKSAGRRRRNSPAPKLTEMIRRSGMQDKVLVASFSDDYMGHFRELCPEVATSASRNELLRFAGSALLGRSYRPETDSIQVLDRLWPVQVITDRFVDYAHCDDLSPARAARCRKLPVHAWTINDLEGMRRMIALGVDGIITDFPGPLLSLLERRGAASVAGAEATRRA